MNNDHRSSMHVVLFKFHLARMRRLFVCEARGPDVRCQSHQTDLQHGRLDFGILQRQDLPNSDSALGEHRGNISRGFLRQGLDFICCCTSYSVIPTPADPLKHPYFKFRGLKNILYQTSTLYFGRPLNPLHSPFLKISRESSITKPLFNIWRV